MARLLAGAPLTSFEEVVSSIGGNVVGMKVLFEFHVKALQVEEEINRKNIDQSVKIFELWKEIDRKDR